MKSYTLTLLLTAAVSTHAFPMTLQKTPPTSTTQRSMTSSSNSPTPDIEIHRRSLISTLALSTSLLLHPSLTNAEENYSPAFVQTYDDFTPMDNGTWQYKDVTIGKSSETVEKGDRVVFDWSGYTIGYFGRPFQAKGGPTGGAFDKDIDFSRTVIGSHTVVQGLEEAFSSMKPGGVRQVIVPYGDLSYPPSDINHDLVGPKPSTFSGQRALNFVLENPRVDRTLLFNVKLIRVDKQDGKGGFKRGDAAR